VFCSGRAGFPGAIPPDGGNCVQSRIVNKRVTDAYKQPLTSTVIRGIILK
jgi:hypothetical protein